MLRFFERDESGHLPREPTCTTTRTAGGGVMKSCSFQSYTVCSDTSHARLAARRGEQAHEVDSAGCSDDDDGQRFVERVEQLPEVVAWIGAP